jgi:hypothetical protein
MSNWRRFHLNETIKALATSDNTRFFVQVREPVGENRQPRACYRSTLESAQETADGIVQSYYPHECNDATCGSWHRSDS